jgi:hypothetical protein
MSQSTLQEYLVKCLVDLSCISGALTTEELASQPGYCITHYHTYHNDCKVK